MKVTVAVAMWNENGKWKCYAEGWAGEDRKGTKDSTRHTISSNGLNNGEPLYWRFIEADIPVPQDTEITVEGTVVGEE